MLRFTLSNRFETLLDRLCGQLERLQGDPFAPAQVIVPSSGIARRIELALADRTGVCANVEFSYLAKWLWRQIRRVVPEVREDSPFAPEVLAWRVYEALGDARFTSAHERLAAYLEGEDAVMRLDLATRIAQLIEQYITYRPDFLEKWSAGKRIPLVLEGSAAADEAWQGALWRRLAEEIGAAREHPSRAFFRRVGEMGDSALHAAGLPESAHVFCVPAMPPLYLEILRKLAPIAELQVYVMNPCQEYWFEVVDPKRLTYLQAAGRAEHHETGNRLLAAWGKQAQSNLEGLLTGESESEDIEFAFEPAAGQSLLARLQNAILALEELAPGSVALAQGDRSIEIHVCHTLTRELEVLHDQLLMMFAGADPPKPGDVLVVTPDLEQAAPLIDAVFGTAQESRRIPYAITGQPQRRVNAVARAFDSLLALTASRHSASAVFELLVEEPIAARFDLGPEDLESIRAWIEASGIRWGLDAQEREAFDLPATEDHTFADGLQRLFLAYSLGETQTSIDGRIGAGDPEGQRAEALGAFWRFVDGLRRLSEDWRRPKDAQGWRDSLSDALLGFVAESAGWAEDFRAVQAAIGELHDRMQRGGLEASVPLDAVRSALGELLDDPARGGVPSGKVTFTSMGSLRNLPYRVVCVLGMNDGAFPTAGHALEFDLIAAAPRRGDRQRRYDERNLFLDLVLAARERLYVSHTGRSVRDNSRKPPSVLVAELLDHAVRACSADPAQEAEVRDRLVVEHPLQPFSAEYFRADALDARRRSFHAEYCAALRQHADASPDRLAIKTEDEDVDERAPDLGLPFFPGPLSPPEPEWRLVRLEQLRSLLLYPCSYLLRRRLGIELGEPDEELADDEPFLPANPSRKALAERLLPSALEGAGEASLLALARSGNEFPAGPLGEAALRAEVRTLLRYAQGLREDRATPAVPHEGALSFRLQDEQWQLAGSLAGLHASGLVRHRYDDVRPSDYLAGWIDHLFLCATASADLKCETHWHSRDGVYVLSPYAESRERLAELMALYREGLQRPLHFFPRSSWAYVIGDSDLKAARNRWFAYWNPARGESRYAPYRLALRGVQDPLDERFTALANRILKPLCDHVSDPRL